MLQTAFIILYYIIHYFFLALILLILARWILSWFRLPESNPIMLFIARCTDPVILPFRRRIPPVMFLDMAAIFALVALYIMQFVLLQALPLP